MIRTKIAAVGVAALAVVAGPAAAAPASAAENHVCAAFADPYDKVCALPFQAYCLVFPTSALCH